ncbi:MAG: tRNA 2-thiouridine(34) synthase MnmA [Patescibacteria group bacterium]
MIQDRQKEGQKPLGKKLFVGMSGGVDSSVSAALLKEAGYHVTGVFLKVWQPDFLPCNWKEERLDAMRVAAVLDIPFVTIDLEKEYKEEVVDYMIAEYRRGRTPNPDVMCNKEIKFGAFLKKALAMGADAVATGHYAQNMFNPAAGTVGLWEMRESADTDKDQTYFLWTLTQERLSKILFPIGHLTKPEVRKLAQKFGLPTAEKKDSQGLCFIGKVDMKDFLAHYIPKNAGKVLDEAGKTIGSHDGATFFTLGQRHGFMVTEKTIADKPLYVFAKDVEANIITVSQRDVEASPLTTSTVIIGSISWTGQAVKNGAECAARIRYRQPLERCTITAISGKSAQYQLHFAAPQFAAAAGQSVVLYQNGVCVGGGIIEKGV